MSKDTLYTIIGFAITVVGVYIVWLVAKTIFGFLLDYWIAILLMLITLVGVGAYLLTKDEPNGS